jgi:hypothetical protein
MLLQPPVPNVVSVTDVYGRRARINLDDYDSGRIQLRLYTRAGKRYEFVPGIRESTTIHRDNIAVLNGKTIRPFV